MAKKRRSRGTTSPRPARSHHPIRSLPTPVLDLPPGYPSPRLSGRLANLHEQSLLAVLTNRALLEVEDNRQWHPYEQPAKTRSGTPARLRTYPTTPKAQSRGLARSRPFQAHSVVPHRVGFQFPERVIVCIRRKVRRGVLHALKLTRKGRGSNRRYTRWSLLGC